MRYERLLGTLLKGNNGNTNSKTSEIRQHLFTTKKLVMHCLLMSGRVKMASNEPASQMVYITVSIQVKQVGNQQKHPRANLQNSKTCLSANTNRRNQGWIRGVLGQSPQGKVTIFSSISWPQLLSMPRAHCVKKRTISIYQGMLILPVLILQYLWLFICVTLCWGKLTY